MNTKLAINLNEGTVEIEGDEEFARVIYQDLKENLRDWPLRQPAPTEIPAQDPTHPSGAEEKTTRQKKRVRRVTGAEGEKSRTSDYKPRINNALKLGELEEFYNVWQPSTHAEKILIFATFLRDNLKIAPCTADDIYTCYSMLKAKTNVPEAFLQAFRDAQNRSHFIEFRSLEDIQVTIIGDNHFNKKLREKGNA